MNVSLLTIQIIAIILAYIWVGIIVSKRISHKLYRAFYGPILQKNKYRQSSEPISSPTARIIAEFPSAFSYSYNYYKGYFVETQKKITYDGVYEKIRDYRSE